jgi:hypothetical protein
MQRVLLLVLGMIVAGCVLLWGLPARSACDPGYPSVCIAPAPPDLDCKDVGVSGFVVTGSDPHGFDSDGDGIGCE